jgi:MFS family permease
VRRAAASAAVAVVALDVTAVSVLLPTLRADLGSSPSGGQWLMNAYLLALAVVLLLAARVRIDNLLTGAGAVAMAAGAVVSATADSTSTLVVGRAVAGAGVGLMLASLAASLPGARRAGVAGAALPLAALALGPLIGGEIAEHNWWHLYFWAGVPAAALLGTAALLDAEPREGPAPPLDRRMLGLAAGLVVVTILFVQSEPWGLGTREVVDVLGVGATVIIAAGVAPGRGVWAAAGGALAALCFLLPQYFELAHLIHPLRSGVRLSALTVAAVAGGALAWPLRSLIPVRVLGLAGAVIAGAGLIALGQLEPKSGTGLLALGLVLAGGGFGVAAGATYDGRLVDLLVAAVTGAALTLAVSGAVFQHVQADQRGNGATFEEALSRGVGNGALILLPLVAAMGVAVWRAKPASSAAPQAAES